MDFVRAAEAAVESGGGSDGYWRLGLILAAIAMLGLYGRWRKARQPPLVEAKELRERDKNPNRYREPADRALVELVEAGREINAQVDTKVRFLNRLIKDADNRIARLEKLIADADGRGAGDAGSRPKTDPAAEKVPETGGPSASRRFRSGLQARIVELRDEGKSVSDIARATGLSTLEIQLAIDHADSGRS